MTRPQTCHQSDQSRLDWPDWQVHGPSSEWGPRAGVCSSPSSLLGSVNSIFLGNKPFPYPPSQPIVLYTLAPLSRYGSPSPVLVLKSFIPSPSDHLSLLLLPVFLLRSLQNFFDLSLSHSLTHTRSSWRCLAVIKTLSRVASQARETAFTQQIRHHNRPHTDVAPSRLQATLAVTTSAPSQEILSMQHLWVLPRIPPPFTSTTKSRTKNTSVLDG